MSRRTATSTAALRPVGVPRGIEVRTGEDGVPLAVSHRRTSTGAGSPAPVESVAEFWRIADAWWREAEHARTYYRVALEGGRLLTIYHDDVTDGWYEQPYTEPRA
jgi:hypothetical protein